MCEKIAIHNTRLRSKKAIGLPQFISRWQSTGLTS